jgi:hypothetical protein
VDDMGSFLRHSHIVGEWGTSSQESVQNKHYFSEFGHEIDNNCERSLTKCYAPPVGAQENPVWRIGHPKK